MTLTEKLLFCGDEKSVDLFKVLPPTNPKGRLRKSQALFFHAIFIELLSANSHVNNAFM
jgi:hypothetical protein